jgi:hypothetical protein
LLEAPLHYLSCRELAFVDNAMPGLASRYRCRSLFDLATWHSGNSR